MPTARRLYRLSQAIHNRQQDIIIALDHIHDQHNLSAVIRTADAAGFGRIIWVPDFRNLGVNTFGLSEVGQIGRAHV